LNAPASCLSVGLNEVGVLYSFPHRPTLPPNRRQNPASGLLSSIDMTRVLTIQRSQSTSRSAMASLGPTTAVDRWAKKALRSAPYTTLETEALTRTVDLTNQNTFIRLNGRHIEKQASASLRSGYLQTMCIPSFCRPGTETTPGSASLKGHLPGMKPSRNL
jgi:hypothetical protein